ALADSGTWSIQIEQPSFGGGNHFVFGVLYSTMVGSNGTFRLRWYGQDTEPIAPGAYSNYMVGTWEVVQGSGAGAYAGLSGHGAWTSVQSGGELTFTGSM